MKLITIVSSARMRSGTPGALTTRQRFIRRASAKQPVVKIRA